MTRTGHGRLICWLWAGGWGVFRVCGAGGRNLEPHRQPSRQSEAISVWWGGRPPQRLQLHGGEGDQPATATTGATAVHTAYETTPTHPLWMMANKSWDAHCSEGPETHHEQATRVFEYHLRDPHSACGETDPHYLLICDADGCLISAEAHARMAGADRTDFYPATRDEIAAVLGGHR